MRIRTELLTDMTVARFARMIPVVDLNPAYQRESGVWRPETRSALIDSIINGLDVPKLYFEAITTRRHTADGLAVQYAVIDGKQRLEAIIAFLRGELGLPSDFIFFEDRDVRAAGFDFVQLDGEYPELAQRFLDFELSIVRVDSDSGDLIEEMFQRLNASTALNAAERRNALSGPTKDAADSLAQHRLLVEKSPIKNARYKYKELAAKFLALEHQMATKQRIADTKAATLYDLFVASRETNPRISAGEMQDYRDRAARVLDAMCNAFQKDDPLLASIGTVVVYYLAFRDDAIASAATRTILEQFETLRRAAAQMREEDNAYPRPANARLREYNVFVQSTNDGRALWRRSEIVGAFVAGEAAGDGMAALDKLGEGELPDREDDSDE